MRPPSRYITDRLVDLNHSGAPRVMMPGIDCSPTSSPHVTETAGGALRGSDAVSLFSRNGYARSRMTLGSPLPAAFLAVMTAVITLLLPAPSFAAGHEIQATRIVFGPYAQWANYPQSPNFLAIAVWAQNSLYTMGTGANYSTIVAAAVGSKINTFLGLSTNSGGEWSPTSFGSGDPNGQFAALYNNGLYLIPTINSTNGNWTPNNTDKNSIASINALAASVGHASSIIGFNMGDEPQGGSCTTWPISALPGQISTLKGYDTTRPLFLNSTDFFFSSGVCSGSLNQNYTAAISVASIDDYPLTNPYAASVCCTGSPVDSMWVQGWTTNQLAATRAAGAPVWMFVDTGTDELGFSAASGGTCNTGTNICSPYNNEYRATAVQVNAEVWMSIINGATGIEYFPQDTLAFDFALGTSTGGQLAISNAIQANLADVNTNLLTYAPEINAATSGYCTMITGRSYTNFVKSCSNGILTVSTASSLPASAMSKTYGGATYLFAQPARIGSNALTFTLAGLAGRTATIVYDSNSKYDVTHDSTGGTFVLNGSAQFTDTLGAGGSPNDDYEVKIYKIQ